MFPLPDRVLEVGADLLPTSAEGHLAGAAEDTVGEFRCPEADEADEARLFLHRRGTVFTFDCGRQPDRFDVVARPPLPTGGETAVPFEMEVLAARPLGSDRPNEPGPRRGGGRRGRRRIVGIVVGRRRQGTEAEAQTGGKAGRPEEIEGEGIDGTHEGLLLEEKARGTAPPKRIGRRQRLGWV